MIIDVRMALLSKGKTLSGWAKEHGANRAFVFRAVKGERRGPRARMLVKKLERELGLKVGAS